MRITRSGVTAAHKRKTRVLRAVLVGRVSTNRRSQDASGPRQISDLRDVARRRGGWVVVGTFIDRVSGAETGPGLREAIDMIVKGAADVLVVTALDRLGRDVREMLANVDKIREWGGHFFVRDDEMDTSSPEGRMLFTILAALAEFQRRANRYKIYAGLDHARKKGVRLGRPTAIPPAALARAVELRAEAPIPSWRTIVDTLAREKLGRHHKGTIAGAVTRRLQSPLRYGLKKTRKTRGFRGGAASSR